MKQFCIGIRRDDIVASLNIKQKAGDLPHLLAFIGDKLGEPMSWESVPATADLKTWLTAPILYFNGQEFPNLLRQGLIPCRCPYSGGSQTPITSRAPGWAFTFSEEVRQPQCSTHRTTCGPINEAATLT